MSPSKKPKVTICKECCFYDNGNYPGHCGKPKILSDYVNGGKKKVYDRMEWKNTVGRCIDYEEKLGK